MRLIHRARFTTLVASLFLLGLNPGSAAAQTPSSPVDVVRSLSAALDSVQARLDAGDAAGARASYDAFENTWFNVEGTVRGLSGGSYRAIEDAMRTLRDALYQGAADPARVRNALTDLRGQVAAFGAPYGANTVATSATGPASVPAPAAQTLVATSAPTAASGPSTEECARYSGQAALPYFEYARQLAGSASPLPGIPPAQAVTPIYSYGPSPVPGMIAAGPFNPVFPYTPRVGPGVVVGGRGVGGGNPVLTSRALNAGFVAGGQLPSLPNGALAPLGPDDILALAGQQATEVGNRIGVADVQQSLVGNQLGTSELRSTWVGTYLTMSEQARDIALSLCGRIPG
jgi:hypothetical protein